MKGLGDIGIYLLPETLIDHFLVGVLARVCSLVWSSTHHLLGVFQLTQFRPAKENANVPFWQPLLCSLHAMHDSILWLYFGIVLPLPCEAT